jgi:hypothetical protein
MHSLLFRRPVLSAVLDEWPICVVYQRARLRDEGASACQPGPDNAEPAGWSETPRCCRTTLVRHLPAERNILRGHRQSTGNDALSLQEAKSASGRWTRARGRRHTLQRWTRCSWLLTSYWQLSGAKPVPGARVGRRCFAWTAGLKGPKSDIQATRLSARMRYCQRGSSLDKRRRSHAMRAAVQGARRLRGAGEHERRGAERPRGLPEGSRHCGQRQQPAAEVGPAGGGLFFHCALEPRACDSSPRRTSQASHPSPSS